MDKSTKSLTVERPLKSRSRTVLNQVPNFEIESRKLLHELK